MPLYPMLLCFLVDCFTYVNLPFLSLTLFIPSMACELGGCAKQTGVHLDLAVFFCNVMRQKLAWPRHSS